MEELRNLNELAKQVVQNFNEKFDARDRVIPQAFKDKVKRLKTFSIVYNEYSVIIKGDGVRSKDSYVPNQSFFMASFFIEYSYELSRYKQKIMPLISDSGISTNDLTAFFTHERDKGKEDIKRNEDKFVKILDSIGYSGSDRNYLIKFVTDYDWWSGSKTIERSDFFNSPVLNIMGLTASSNAAMALIVDHLTQNPGLSNLLLNQINVGGNSNMDNGNLQQIFYGAPGTGKSNTIKMQTAQAEKEERVFRTTFHPDSDYSTFVGCYKPWMEKNKSGRAILDYEAMVDKFKEYINATNNNMTQASVLFGHDFHNSIVHMLESTNHTIVDLVTDAYKSGSNFDTSVRAGMSVYEKNPQSKNGQIVYKFVPQAFTNAYVKAWNTEDDVYLIIEEINRGNCAQIFGDLFQLLDRENGVSEYPIEAETDLMDYLSDELANSKRDDFPEGVREGKKLVLPKNLYIWATMNTSDQSLFPIDSAFKRRWDWKYIPIKEGHEKRNIIAKGMKYDWWTFVDRMNSVVGEATSSEDKKMGFYFCKANDKKIDADTFVSKVVFYLWNDVFKDNGLDWLYDGIPVFKYKETQSEGVEKDVEMTFASFFNADGSANEEQVVRLMANLKIEGTPVGLDGEKQDNEDYNEEEDAKKDMTVVLNGETIHEASPSDTFVKVLQTIGFETFADKEIAKNIVVSRNEQDSRSWRKVNDYFVYTGWWAYYKKGWLREMSKELGVDLTVE